MATRVAVVTGANKGIGFGIVRNLCRLFKGDVLLTARSAERGEAAVKKLKEEGLSAKFHQLDINDKQSIKNLRDYLLNEYGGLDVLVNNAAIAYTYDSPASVLEQAENTVGTNFFATRDVCNILFPILRPHARVVNVSSSAGMLQRIPSQEIRARFASPTLTEDELVAIVNEYLDDVRNGVQKQKGWPPTTYIASKVPLTALTFIQQRNFDKDPREDIIVNAVHPGYVDTDMTCHKGHLTIEQGAEAPTFLALLPPNVKEPKGQMVWFDKRIVNWFTDK
ncbi:Carbonyl reductase [NADPH] 1-like protein [Dinothrombium tinctorium]|uniref:carbonyl reductase (NADPH) n=1 Tax=Dinothrombium tinctorium TaxID=1965070 RepID=A0A443RRD1_9ACAR|nr:Carbonyl reductase [NADPH] 1-like protein [Dinothrombium tinctorium]